VLKELRDAAQAISATSAPGLAAASELGGLISTTGR
jgi:hypothetical protein